MISINKLITRTKVTRLFFAACVLAIGLALTPVTVVNADELEQTTQAPVEVAQTIDESFDAVYYANQNPDVVAIFGTDAQTLYSHYVNFGKAEGRYANAEEALNTILAQAPSTEDTTLNSELPDSEADDDGVYNILAIGNSITLHPVCSYWWGSWGMAASSMDKDYIHQVQAGLSQKYSSVSLDIISVQNWETSSSRSKQLAKFDTKLANNYDLVIIQLGENVNDMTTFKKDFDKLVSHVQDAQKDAQIVVVGDYWYRYGRDTAKKSVATKHGCNFIDISAIRGDKRYSASRGSKVLGDDGQLHSITNSWVMKHPNDAGMEYIANKILEVL